VAGGEEARLYNNHDAREEYGCASCAGVSVSVRQRNRRSAGGPARPPRPATAVLSAREAVVHEEIMKVVVVLVVGPRVYTAKMSRRGRHLAC